MVIDRCVCCLAVGLAKIQQVIWRGQSSVKETTFVETQKKGSAGSVLRLPTTPLSVHWPKGSDLVLLPSGVIKHGWETPELNGGLQSFAGKIIEL